MSRTQNIEAYSRFLGPPEGVYLEGKFRFAIFNWDKEKQRYGRTLCKNPTADQLNTPPSSGNCKELQWVKEAKVLEFAYNYITQANRSDEGIPSSKTLLTQNKPTRVRDLIEYIEQFKPVDASQLDDKSAKAEFEAEINPALHQLLRISEGIDYAEKFIKEFALDKELITFIRGEDEKVTRQSSEDFQAKNSYETLKYETFKRELDELKVKFATKIPFKPDSMALRNLNENIRPALKLLNMAFAHEKEEDERFASRKGLTLKDVLKPTFRTPG